MTLDATDELAAAFGYSCDDNAKYADLFAIGQGLHGETLEPVVVFYLRHSEGGDLVGYALAVDQAEHLAEQLVLHAEIARRNHFA